MKKAPTQMQWMKITIRHSLLQLPMVIISNVFNVHIIISNNPNLKIRWFDGTQGMRVLRGCLSKTELTYIYLTHWIIQHWSLLLVQVLAWKLHYLHAKDMPWKTNCTFFFLGHDKIAELLIQNGANVTVVAQHGSAALIWAAIKGMVIRTYVAAEINIPDLHIFRIWENCPNGYPKRWWYKCYRWT